jgi:hypothetical protein
MFVPDGCVVIGVGGEASLPHQLPELLLQRAKALGAPQAARRLGAHW